MEREALIQLCKTQPERAADLILSLIARIEQLEAKGAEFEARLNKNSSNSSKPPSSDGYKKPFKNNNSRKKSGKKTGGQKGHKGKTLKMSETPDHIFKYFPEECLNCKKFKICKEKFDYERRQVHDIVKPAIDITEHRVYHGECPQSGMNVKANFPENVKSPVSYGTLVQSLVILIKNYQFVPYERTCEFLRDVFGLELSQGSIANFENRCADNLSDYYTELVEEARQAKILHADETGIRLTGVLFWLHVYSNDSFTFYAYHKNRGKKAIDAIGILMYFTGLLCHDFWAAYFDTDCRHSMCNAHLLRELKAMLELYGENWAEGLIEMLLEIKKRAESTSGNSISSYLYTRYKNRWLDHIRKAIKLHPPPKKIPGKRGRPKKGKILSLLERLYNHADDILRFARESIATFDNNLAERDLRMMKTKLKISGCFRSPQGAEAFCIIRSYISTVKKQSRNVFDAIQLAVCSKPRFRPE